MSPILGLHLHLLMLKKIVHQGGDPIAAKKKKKELCFVFWSLHCQMVFQTRIHALHHMVNAGNHTKNMFAKRTITCCSHLLAEIPHLL